MSFVKSFERKFARLHIVTNDEIVAAPAFIRHATSIMQAGGSAVAVHLRMKHANARTLHETARQLAAAATATGSALIVNDRVDVAQSVGALIVHLGFRSIPVESARDCGLLVGYSAHSVDEAAKASGDGADYIYSGTIWPSASHPGECTAGLEQLAEAVSLSSCPVYAIGGVTPSRAQAALLAGAFGVAAISGIWSATDPAHAVTEYLEAMQVMT